MTDTFRNLRINPHRMLAAFNELAQIGTTGDGGVHRPTFSDAHLAARQWFREQIENSGSEFRTDGAGNYSAFLDCGDDHAPTFLLGSHLDSVPKGGRFDGALGVMAAFEVLRTVKDAGIKPNVNLEAIDFTDEEGTLVGLLGSAAIAGHFIQKSWNIRVVDAIILLEGMKRASLSDESMLSAARPKESLAGYLELHIEQGKRLERAGINVGVVSAIVGIWSYCFSFIGRADHAGQPPWMTGLMPHWGKCIHIGGA